MRSPADRIGIALLGGCLVVLVASSIVGVALRQSERGINPETGCAPGTEPSAETVVLVDLTDPLPQAYRVEMREYFRRLTTDCFQPNERLTLWTLSGARDGALRKRFCRCCPARMANPLIGNSDLAAAVSESLFAKPLRQALDSLPTHETAAATPLLEAVHQVCSQPEFQERGIPRRLVIVSNLEQNSEVLCLYKSAPDFPTFSHTSSYGRVRVDLRGAAVVVFFAPHGRAAADLGTTLTDFWSLYLLACGAASVQVRRL